VSSRYKAGISWLPHHLTFTVIHWIDVFTREAYKEIIVESLRYCTEHKGLSLHAWVIMPNHIHLIASTREDFLIPDFVRDFKKYTSK
jgi:REP element-mobilizing transposase RayT